MSIQRLVELAIYFGMPEICGDDTAVKSAVREGAIGRGRISPPTATELEEIQRRFPEIECVDFPRRLAW